ncbi:Translocation protein-like protein [Hapsidospora chrysogenum ATCC 11550]|uniref:Translocation protein-like protein n=1 Tax=Hapsidospora chrysogenum (strain ATCC 11550 / CBS 779.69 / DSM 880 / IAM 14645 / JCM 23072 / IMI 49137) TaxID=857340 RepID=A0A086SZF0_HAPC1|nr:Translocation protein-like protein [Hapsidospora chrysogenum ATCC 11550]
MSDLTHFDMQPLHMDPQSKAITVALNTKAPRALHAELEELNTLHRALVGAAEGVSQHGVPLPPVPVNPKRSANVTKLRDNGNAEYRKQRYAEALKLYTLGIQMAEARPLWEPSALTREELSALYANRAQAYMAMQQWAEGAVDAETSVEVKKVGNSKAWWRRGKCLLEMGRLDEARDWVKKGLEVEGEEAELRSLLEEIDGKKTKST